VFHAYGKGVIGTEGDLAGDELVKQDAEGVDVGCRFGRFAFEAFRSHVGRRPVHSTGGRQVRRRFIERVEAAVEKMYDAKIDKINAAPRIDERIAGFNIAMHYAMLIGIVDGACQLVQVSCNLCQG